MSVKVAVRCRPFNQRELDLNTQCCVQMQGQSTILINLAFDKDKIQNEKDKQERERTFNFDYSFWSHDGFETDGNGIFVPVDSKYADQQQVYKKVGQEVLDNAWQGYHCCLFAYGQTGSGKSYSMIGVPPNVGIVPIACEEIFKRIESNNDKNCEYEVQFSMLEIYNEKIQDLIIPVKMRPQAGLKVREHKQLGVYVENLSKYAVESYEEIQEKMEEGNRNRTIASTLMNAHSSRAHTIIAIEFKQVQTIEKKKTSKFSMIYLVDLAGSEKIGKTGTTGDRLKEGCNINKSLHYLGMVISNLADKAMGKGKNTVTPYRDSVLTHILKNALGGNSKTLMICAVSPAFDNYDETLSTLRYADQAKKIKLNAVINESEQDKMIRELQGENARLKEMLEKMEKDKSPSKGLDLEARQRIHALEEELNQNKTLMSEYEKTYKEKLIEQKEQKKKKEEEEKPFEIDLTKPNLLNLNEDPQLNGKLTYELVKEKTIIGRKTTNEQEQAPDIMLGSLGIEPTHMMIFNDGKALWIEPFNAKCSKNSFLNGDRITVKKQLHHNDRLILGNNNSAFLVKIPSEGVPENREINWEFALTELMEKDMKRRQDEEKEAEMERKKEIEQKMQELEDQYRKEKEETEQQLKQEASLYQKQIKDLEEKIVQESQKQKFEKQKKDAQQQWEQKLKEVEQIREQKERERQRKLRMLNLEEKLKQIKENDKRWLLRKLKKHIPLLRELNLICKELKRRVCFLPKLNYQWYDLNDLILNEDCYTKQKKDILQIMVINAEENMVYVWPLGKFSNRYYMLKEVLDQYFATNELPELGKDDDPCWDPVEPVLIAQGYLMLKPLAYKMDNPATVTLVDDQGECGTLKINVIPTDESGNTPQCDVNGNIVDDPVILLGKRLDFLIYIDMAMFNSNACYDSFVNYQLPIDHDLKNIKNFETKIVQLILLLSQFQFAGNSQSPKYDYNQHHTYKAINQQMLDFIQHKNLCFQVYGYLDAKIALEEWKEDIKYFSSLFSIDENFPNLGADQEFKSQQVDFQQMLESEEVLVAEFNSYISIFSFANQDSPQKTLQNGGNQQVFQNQFFQPENQQPNHNKQQQQQLQQPQSKANDKKQNQPPQKTQNANKKSKKDKDCKIF